MTPNILVTGFDAFGGDQVNPSWMVAKALHGRKVVGHVVVAAQLPTEFGASGERLRELLRSHRPALVVCLGLAGGRSAISLERVATNINDARIADNAGAQPIDTLTAPRGPAAYFSTLPIKTMLLAMQACGVPTEVSNSAGTFVCNHVFYVLMRTLQRTKSGARGGFIHLPWVPQHAPAEAPAGCSIELTDMVRALQAGLRAALRRAPGSDLQLGAGRND
jgi:pyroglutamyl-peptidase